MSLAILFHFLCAQHVSDINISIIRGLRLFCLITPLVALFFVRCVLEFRCGWVVVVSMLQAVACNTDTTLLYLNLLFISIQCDLIVLLYKFSSSLYTVFIHL